MRLSEAVGIGDPKPIRLNGCHNRPPKPATVTVQDGWIEYRIQGIKSRLPRMIQIPDPMSDDCRYDKARSDTGCIGCIHMPEKKA